MSTEENEPQKRVRPDRPSLSAEVNVRRSGVHAFRVRVFDLSPEGCKMEFVERPSLGERVWVKFDGLESIEATVRWIDGHYGGVQFERPIYDAVFRRLLG
jgi:hypothetical protein